MSRYTDLERCQAYMILSVCANADIITRHAACDLGLMREYEYTCPALRLAQHYDQCAYNERRRRSYGHLRMPSDRYMSGAMLDRAEAASALALTINHWHPDPLGDMP